MKVYLSKFPLEATNTIIEEIRTYPKDQFSAPDIFEGASRTVQTSRSKVYHLLDRIEKGGGIKRVGKNGVKVIFQRNEAIYSNTFDPTFSDCNLVFKSIKCELPNEFTYKDVSDVTGNRVDKHLVYAYIRKLVREGKINKRRVIKNSYVHIIFSKTPATQSEEKMDEYQFTVNAIKNLRIFPNKGIHTVFQGYNESFRDYFGTDPVKAVQRMVDEGKIATRLCKGGAIIYLPKDSPELKMKPEDTVDKILKDEETKTEDLGETFVSVLEKFETEPQKEAIQNETQFSYLDLGKSIEAILNEKSEQILTFKNQNKELISENKKLQEEIVELKQDHRQSLDELTQLRQQVRKQQEQILDLQKKFTLNNFK